MNSITRPTHIDVNVIPDMYTYLLATRPSRIPPFPPPLSLPLFRCTKEEIGQGVGSCALREDSLQLLFTESPSPNGAQSKFSASFLIPASSLRSPSYFNSSLLLCLRICRILVCHQPFHSQLFTVLYIYIRKKYLIELKIRLKCGLHSKMMSLMM